ncbi:hypothetical protein ATM97_07110 [Nocardia sp. MH4]|uniref:hypothetical protein n=1 Tax=Nocardia sp. MH4 TaxID=1768677 RepID=UPI001C4F167F|nr:hypothetical protein [Nocardia sp. MH4]MBW0270781.1 hypothetical protein [Nocardia sp. MH4]
MPDIPTEAEIRAGAKELGLADENGNYRQRDRNRIAAAVQAAKQEAATAADPAAGTTAAQLAQFADELNTAGPFRDETTTAVLVEAARHLLEAQGLRLASREETTPS